MEDGAHGLLTTTGSNRIYRHRNGYQTASQTTHVRLGKGAVFEYIPDSTIPYARSRFWQKSDIQLAPGAKLFWSEILNPGREGFNERFEWELFGNEMCIQSAGVPILWEKWFLEGNNTQFASPAFLGPWRYSATFVVCECGLSQPKLRQLESQLHQIAHSFSNEQGTWGVSRLSKDGVLVRGFSYSGRQLPAQIEEFHNCSREFIIGENLIMPRKIF